MCFLHRTIHDRMLHSWILEFEWQRDSTRIQSKNAKIKFSVKKCLKHWYWGGNEKHIPAGGIIIRVSRWSRHSARHCRPPRRSVVELTAYSATILKGTASLFSANHQTDASTQTYIIRHDGGKGGSWITRPSATSGATTWTFHVTRSSA